MPQDRDRNVVVIESDGALKLDAEAQRRLAGRPGRFRVVPTAGEIVILQRVADNRTGASVSGIAPGRVTLAGEVDAVGGLVDVISFILSQTWSGQLAIVDGNARKTIYFKRGDVRAAASNVAEDRLGAILYRYGVVTEEQLQTAVAACSGAVKLGHVLVEQNILTPHDLYTYVRKQVEEIFFSVLVMRAGAFYFYRTDEDQGPVSQLSLSTNQLLFDGVRRIDELSYFREKLPSADVILQRRHPAPATKLEAKEERVLQLVDGARDLAAIARRSHLGEFDTTKVLYQLLTSGFIEIKQQPVVKLSTSRPGDSLQDIFGKVVDAFNEVYAKIFTAVAQRGKAQPLLKGLESFFGSVAEFAPLFSGVSMDDSGTLSRDALLANLYMAPSDNKLDYLHRGLNELLFFELFTAGEAVDRREEIELHQRLNQIMRGSGGQLRTHGMAAEAG
ncbi:MAG: DUF4388 domain-containing protein, partial [Myxococcales bacterium]|nr:DUF4388 domain-containing protein [Myxococcales bacterium]